MLLKYSKLHPTHGVKDSRGKSRKKDELTENSLALDEQGMYPKCLDTATFFTYFSPLEQVEAYNIYEVWLLSPEASLHAECWKAIHSPAWEIFQKYPSLIL